MRKTPEERFRLGSTRIGTVGLNAKSLDGVPDAVINGRNAFMLGHKIILTGGGTDIAVPLV